MIYLLAKYSVLFALTGILGFLLGRWWVRRSFVDVTESYQTLSKTASEVDLAPVSQGLANLDARISALPEPQAPDLTPLREGIANLDARIGALPKPEKPAPVDLAPVNQRIDRLEALIKGLPRPAERVDLTPLGQGLADLDARISALPKPERPAVVNLEPLNQRIAQIEQMIKTFPRPQAPDLTPLRQGLVDLGTRVSAIPPPVRAERVNLEPVNQRIDRLEALIKSLPRPEKPEPVDLTPIRQSIANLEARVRAIPAPEKAERIDLAPINQRMDDVEAALRAIKIPSAPELGPVNERLHVIQTQLGQLAKRPVAEPAKPATRPAATSERGPQLLKSASFGKRDNLKRISGVGPKLERLLNKNGVFYFWQIADWSATDIRAVDDRLEVFKGRIARDNWVNQAKSLVKQLPTAAKRPPAADSAVAPA